MADPFAAVENPSPDTATATGSLGGSPDFWRNLMNFGAADLVAANARTPQGFLEYGPGWQGALGAGILGAENQQRQNASLNSQINLQQAQAGLTGAQAEMQRLQVPFALARLQWALNQGQPGAGQSAGPLGNTQPSPLATGVSAVESGGNPNAVNSQGFTGQFQIGTAAMADAGIYTPAKGEDLSKNKWSGTVNIPGLQPMNQQQFLANPAAQKAAFQGVTANLMKRAGSMGLNNYVGKTVGGVPMTANSLLAGMYFAGPTGMQQFLQTNGSYDPVDSNGRSLTAYLQRFAAAAGGAQQQPQQSSNVPGMPTPQQALARANAMYAQARQAAIWGFQPYADTLSAQAKQLEDYGLSTIKPFTTYRGGVAWNPNFGFVRPGSQTTLQTPSGATIPAFEFPPINAGSGSLPGAIIPASVGNAPQAGSATGAGTGAATGQPLFTKIAPGTQKTINELAEEYGNEGQKSYDAAISTLGSLQQMLTSFGQLNGSSGTGWMSTGSGNEMRVGLVKGVNGLLGAAGIAPIAPDAVAGWEELNKATRVAGMQLVHSMFGGSREASMIVQGATSSVPSAENTPRGALRVLYGIQQASMEEVDRRIFETNWLRSHDGNLIGAAEAFNQQRTPAMYSRRAISFTDPYAVKSASEATKQFLPGTYVKFPNGQVAVVPGQVNLTLTATQ